MYTRTKFRFIDHKAKTAMDGRVVVGLLTYASPLTWRFLAI